MEIKKLSNFLEKFKNLARSNEITKKEIIDVVFKKTGARIGQENIIIKDTVLTIKENPTVKSVIFIHKQRIIEELKEKLGKNSPTDIR